MWQSRCNRIEFVWKAFVSLGFAEIYRVIVLYSLGVRMYHVVGGLLAFELSDSFCDSQSIRVIINGITANPDSAWVTQQARNVTMEIADLGFPTPEVLIIDHDSKYTKEFDAVWSAEGTRVKRVGPFAPNLNAFAERFAQTLRHECLDHFLILGEKHLRHLLKEFLEHYHEERPHQSLGNRPPNQPQGPDVIPFVKDQQPVKFACRERLGGLLKTYSRIAA
jgi:hypothetical protein